MLAALYILITALCAAESNNGMTSRNQLQIQEICVADVNRIYGTKYAMRDVYDKSRSFEIAELYLTYWGGVYRVETKKQPTPEVYARIWNGGPDGWRKRATVKYWRRVQRELYKAKKRGIRK